MLNIAITGAGGRMGQTLIRLLADSDEANLTVAVGRRGSPHVGVDVATFTATESNGVVVDDLESAVEQFDILIDFSQPEATVNNLSVCARHGKAMVIGNHRHECRSDISSANSQPKNSYLYGVKFCYWRQSVLQTCRDGRQGPG